MSSGDKALKMGPNKGREGRKERRPAAGAARIVIGGTAVHCREKERGKENGGVRMREPRRDAAFHPHLSLSLSLSLSSSRTRWNSLDGRKKGLTSQIMPTEHGNAFRFEERLVGHLASLGRLLRCRLSPKRNGEEEKVDCERERERGGEA